ncbi:hypothetical protein GPECTOR_61g866 [Gonium pectorale]|uniref:Uncharacterized protein n=1 Tax=Gonium pectorale TaxID=33097 RepID=A0A150G549_GONPE|nr:hypothetical protein GPECTOR_61g866 [Gonium pectorale]|eukprot:KXZ44913.1 hypothetical protein GPECTOR_61g866 [Gonium pectorale]
MGLKSNAISSARCVPQGLHRKAFTEEAVADCDDEADDDDDDGAVGRSELLAQMAVFENRIDANKGGRDPMRTG